MRELAGLVRTSLDAIEARSLRMAAKERVSQGDAARARLEAGGWPPRYRDEAFLEPWLETKVTAAVEAWGGEGVLVLSGSTGVGKTVSASRHCATSGGERPRFVAAPALLHSRFDTASLRGLHSASMQLLDDLGCEDGRAMEFWDGYFEQIYNRRGRVIVTTNLTIEEFTARYGARLRSRLAAMGKWRNCKGFDLRRQNI